MKVRNNIPSLAVAAALLCFACACNLQKSYASPVLTGDTSRPESSTFANGEDITLTFSVSGLAVNQTENLLVHVQDEQGNRVCNWRCPVAGNPSGDWDTTWAAPSATQGFYRVYAQLSDGTPVSGLGSRPTGYLTYCVVPDPALRVTPSEATARFGMQGGFNKNVDIMPYLGVRWVLETYNWDILEATGPGEFATNLAAATALKEQYPTVDNSTDTMTYNGKPWQVYTVAVLNKIPSWAEDMNTNSNPDHLSASSGEGAIAASAQADWTNYVTAVAKDYASIYANEPEHYYQLTWEPDYAYCFSGSHQDIANIHAWAYSAIHSVDPKAVVVGPTHNCLWTNAIKWNQDMYDVGINNYIDGVSIHPYFSLLTGKNVSGSVMPETVGVNGSYIANIRALEAMFPGKPFDGTEQGFNTNAFSDATGGEDNELTQAESLIRENLILLGEGYKFNMEFYITDMPGTNNDYGFYYNLVAGEPIGSTKIGPRPVAPAYAASSFLLDGSTTLGPIPNLATNEYGYGFQNGSKVTLVLWSNTTGTQQLTLPVGVSSVQKYDWMGNATTVAAVNNSVTLTVGPEPIYITGATAAAAMNNP